MDTKYPMIRKGIVIWRQPFGGNLVYKNGAINTVNHAGREIIELSNGENNLIDISKTMAKRHEDSIERVLPIISSFIEVASKKGQIEIVREKQSKIDIVVNGALDYYSPFHANLEITTRCNLKCKHCYVDAGSISSEEMKKDDVIRTIDKLQKSGVVTLCLTGGEPLLHKDFFEILDYSAGRFPILQIFTNGWLIDENAAKKIAKYKNVICQVSLDGDNAETHDIIRGVNGSFERVCRAIKLLSENKVPTYVAMTVMPFSMNQLRSTQKLVKQLGAVKFRAGRITPTGRAKELGWDLNKEQTEKIEKIVSDLCKMYENEIEPWQSAITDEQVQISKNTINCGAGYMQITISPKGDLRPCPTMDAKKYVLGNILEEEIPELWRKEIIKGYSKVTSPTASALCAGCEKQHICRICISTASVIAEEGNCPWADKELKHLCACCK